MNGELVSVDHSSVCNLCADEDQWMSIREDFIRNSKTEDTESAGGDQEEDSLLKEAEKLVGMDLIELND